MTGKYGDTEGETCNRTGCEGTIAERPIEGCSCHISPPCGACTTPREHCPECGWSAEEEARSFYHNDLRCTAASEKEAKLGMWGSGPIAWEPRPLDPSKIDYRTKSHTNSSQICEGIYPPGATRADVEAQVKGTFGGRFARFGGGKFKYIAYTD